MCAVALWLMISTTAADFEECFAANKACRFAVGGLLDGGRLDGGLTRRRYADHIFKMVQRFVAASALYESFFVVANIVNLLSLIKTLDLLRFHKRLALLTSTIEDAAVDILHFLIIMALFVFGCARASRRARRGRRG